MTGEITVSLGVIGLVLAFVIFGMVKRYPVTIERVREIGDEIHRGAMVFIKREYSMLGMFALALLVGLYFSLGWITAMALSTAGVETKGVNCHPG